tara:strand:- start:101 stop:490 length:390 start_codon:yes stop_codon:yes gene_type:complete
VLKKKCFSINTLNQVEELIKLKNNKRIKLIIFIKNYLVKGFGIEWLNTIIKLIKKKYSQYNIKFYVDAGDDHGLSILILRENIDYLKLKSNKIILIKIKQIAKKNKVLLNPKFDVVDLSKIKNYRNLKI